MAEHTDTALAWLKRLAVARGYRIDVAPDGTERLVRPDGTVAVIARPPNKRAEGE